MALLFLRNYLHVSATKLTQSVVSLPQLTDPQQIEKRKRFWELENELESKVNYDSLSEAEKNIHALHRIAVLRGHFTYDDPDTGDRVLTRLRHFLKGACCGSACRHCIYDHVKVPEVKKKGRRFNSAFWLYDQVEEDSEEDEMLKRMYRTPPRKQANLRKS